MNLAASTKVRIQWKWIHWKPGNTWSADILPQLSELGVTEAQLKRCVYVIRANGNFAIRYPKGNSPTLYIGEGNFKYRLQRHSYWLGELHELVGEFSFEIGICFPRVRNSYKTYCDFEAALLEEFKSIYGCAPLRNAQMESRTRLYDYYPIDEVRSAIMIGKGVRYKWAIEPMKSSRFYDLYWRTADTI
jgi:hypothetical protein